MSQVSRRIYIKFCNKNIFFISTEALRDLQDKNLKSMWEKNTQINLSNQGKLDNLQRKILKIIEKKNIF